MLLIARGKDFVWEGSDFTNSQGGNGSAGRDVMLQRVQGVKGSFGRDYVTDNARGKGVRWGRRGFTDSARGKGDGGE